jgi:hypothetical protein
LCGCEVLGTLGDVETTGDRRADAAARKAREEFGREQQRRWGCPYGGHKPLATFAPDDEDLADEIDRVRDLTGADIAPCQCPFVPLRSGPVAEIQTAIALATDLHVAMETTLGRALTAVDIAAITEHQRGKVAAMRHADRLAAQDAKKPK